MHALRLIVAFAWIPFWIYWIVSAFGAKQSRRRGRRIALTGLTALAVVLLVRVFRNSPGEVHSLVLEVIGSAIMGTALVTNLIGLVVAAVLGVYFYFCSSVEEKTLATAFPSAYPAYRASTKMLIPFVL